VGRRPRRGTRVWERGREETEVQEVVAENVQCRCGCTNEIEESTTRRKRGRREGGRKSREGRGHEGSKGLA
jgi:hypothetical protein